MRFWTVFSRWVGPGGPALGSDSIPALAPDPLWDNLLVGDRSLTYRDTGQTHRIAVAYAGPVQISADLCLYEEATEKWYRVSSSPVLLPPNAITFFDIVVPLTSAERLQGNNLRPGGEFQCVLIPYNPGGLPLGELKFAMSPNLSDPSSGRSGGSGPATDVNITSPIPLPVSLPAPATFWFPETIGILSNSGVFKASSGKFHQLVGFSSNGSKRFFMLFNSPTVPVNGTESWLCLNVPAGGTFSVDFSRPRTFSTGLSWAISSTPDVLTLDPAGTFWAQVEIE